MIERLSIKAYKNALSRFKEQGNTKYELILGENGIDMDCLLMYASNSLKYAPNLVAFFDKLYKTDKVNFFNSAKDNIYYNDPFFSDGNLEKAVSMKRTFGILLCSIHDEELLNKVLNAIGKEYSWMIPLSKKFSKKEYEKIINSFSGTYSNIPYFPRESGCPNAIFTYFLFMENGYDTEKKDIWDIYCETVDWLKNHFTYSLNSVLDRLDSVNYRDEIVFSKQFRELFNACDSGSRICDILSLSEYYLLNKTANNQDLRNFFDVLLSATSKNEANNYKLEFVFRNISMLGSILDINSLSFTELFWNNKISLQKRERLLKVISSTNHVLAHNATLNDDIKEENLKIFRSTTLTQDYIIALLFDILADTINKNKSFYFKNNSETEFYEIEKYQEKALKIENELEKYNLLIKEKDEEINFLKKQIEELKNTERKENKEIIKPYVSEISFLNKKITELSSKLDEEAEKTKELNRLRDFAFSVTSSDVFEEKSEPLQEYIQGKKVTIIGGHINWQNKINNKYPEINVIDGHSTSLDIRAVLSSDYVFLYTGNMSHSVYYKIIEKLRKSNVCFYYLGKYNVDLFEKEIIENLKN